MKATRIALVLLAALMVPACGKQSAAKQPSPTQPSPTQPSPTQPSPTQPSLSQPSPDTPVPVVIHNFAFNPNPVTVQAGHTVVWQFDDGSIPHNVTGDGWASPTQSGGDYTHTFDTPGTYTYRCTIHQGMDGEVVVTPR